MEKYLDSSKSRKQLQAIQNYVKKLFLDDCTGHDFYHMKRVADLSKLIAVKEEADVFISEVGGWLHDLGDEKLFEDPTEAKEDMIMFLYKINFQEQTIARIMEAIKDISFRDQKTPRSLEGKIIQDADRLDAIGAIGIARAFAYGGANKQLIYNHENPKNTSIQHFYDKLLLLKDNLNTNSAKELAEERHSCMKSFLEQFFKEWTI